MAPAHPAGPSKGGWARSGSAFAGCRAAAVKAKIHPNYVQTKVTCACGATHEVWSTKPVMRVDVCSSCHPFYTGKQRIVDSGGRVERFLKKYEQSKQRKAAAAR